MSRVVNIDSPGKRRNQRMRDCAELLRRLVQKQGIDEEAKDMLAALILALRDIDEGLEESVVAWEKRDYWVKVEQFKQRWSWVGQGADELAPILRAGSWEELPLQLAQLLPHFADITINKFTRSSSLWDGKYQEFTNGN